MVVLPTKCPYIFFGWVVGVPKLFWADGMIVVQDCSEDDFLKGLKYAVATSNTFFKTLRSCGVFIAEPKKSVVYFVGQAMCVSLSILVLGFHVWYIPLISFG